MCGKQYEEYVYKLLMLGFKGLIEDRRAFICVLVHRLTME